MYRSKEKFWSKGFKKSFGFLNKSLENFKFIYGSAFQKEIKSGTINGFACYVNIPNQTSHDQNFGSTKMSECKPLAEFLSVIWP